MGDCTLAAGQPRILGLERHVAELQQEVQSLRNQFTAASANAIGKTGVALACTASSAAKSRSTPDSSPPPEATDSKPNGGQDDEAVWATNRKLQAKVLTLQEQLRAKQASAVQLGSENSASELPCKQRSQTEIKFEAVE